MMDAHQILTSKQNSVLILGDSSDPHTQAVASKLVASNCSILIRDIWDEPYEKFLLHIGSGIEIPFFKGIWLRLKPRLGLGLSESEAFILRERKEALMSYITLANTSANLVNDPYKQELARNKPYQLASAIGLGLSIPRTWITNDADTLKQASLLHGGKLVYKCLTWLASLDGKVLFTNTISQEEILIHKDTIRIAPGIYQEVVPKKCEYRVTIIDDQIFSVRIFSQEKGTTSLDWRRDQSNVRYEGCTLSSSLQKNLILLMQHLGLRYAAIDLIETPDDQIVFLEANPTGNWLWLEEKLNLPISANIAASLLGK